MLVISKLQAYGFDKISCILVENYFTAAIKGLNHDKFQFILFHNAVQSSDKSMKIGDTMSEPLESVKLLDVFVDRRLNFNVHISETCKKAGK